MSDLVTEPAPEAAPEKLTAWQRWEAPNFDSGTVFRAGGVYRYHDVPESVYHGLMAAPSHGTFFQKHIKVQYTFVKVS